MQWSCKEPRRLMSQSLIQLMNLMVKAGLAYVQIDPLDVPVYCCTIQHLIHFAHWLDAHTESIIKQQFRHFVSHYVEDFVTIKKSLFAESPRTPSRSGEDWRSAFDSASNGPVAASTNSESRSRSTDGRSRRYENGDVSSGANSGSRRTPNRLPPAPPKY